MRSATPPSPAAASLSDHGVSLTQYDNDVQIDVTAPFGHTTLPITVHGVFQVAAGSHTFYFIAKQWSGFVNDYVTDPNFTVLFVPTAYGSVTPTLLAPPQDKGDSAPASLSMSAADIKNEQSMSMSAELARRDAELAAYQSQLDALRARLDSVEQQQRVHAPRPAAPPIVNGSKAR